MKRSLKKIAGSGGGGIVESVGGVLSSALHGVWSSIITRVFTGRVTFRGSDWVRVIRPDSIRVELEKVLTRPPTRPDP